jgi:cytoskeletal protein CcmA (bactofilin family)
MRRNIGEEGSAGNRNCMSSLGPELVITGSVFSVSALRIEGRVRGDVQCASLLLAEKAEIEGNLTAEEVVIHGRLIGSVQASRVVLEPSSHVEGDVVHTSLAVALGAYFNGKSSRREDQASDAELPQPRVTTVPPTS